MIIFKRLDGAADAYQRAVAGQSGIPLSTVVPEMQPFKRMKR